MLFQDEDNRRYEVELQLGSTDEKHLVRTLEYWDIERKRYPQYDHCAVIVAEEITSRFLNVISLFNGSVPIIAIQVTALRLGDGVGLLFTTVLNELQRGLVDEDEPRAEAVDREYWEARASKSALQLADRILGFAQALDPAVQLNFTKGYVGFARDGIADNFIVLHPKQRWLTLALRLDKSDEIDALVETAGLDSLNYNRAAGRYRVRLAEADFNERSTTVQELIERAFRQAASE